MSGHAQTMMILEVKSMIRMPVLAVAKCKEQGVPIRGIEVKEVADLKEAINISLAR